MDVLRANLSSTTRRQNLVKLCYQIFGELADDIRRQGFSLNGPGLQRFGSTAMDFCRSLIGQPRTSLTSALRQTELSDAATLENS